MNEATYTPPSKQFKQHTHTEQEFDIIIEKIIKERHRVTPEIIERLKEVYEEI